MIVFIGGYILLTAAYVFFKVAPILLLILAAASALGMGGGIWMFCEGIKTMKLPYASVISGKVKIILSVIIFAVCLLIFIFSMRGYVSIRL
ncbi:hypothetical protein UYO_2415 [Lachnospiraceae bacterium JC7]|nr:hypothetical protein [Oribacterium sp. P6A1]ETP71659.1 hypothetical protein UYO_2415 [Lachnospiraceae bacterium JC7]